jgi:hypothetical protein
MAALRRHPGAQACAPDVTQRLRPGGGALTPHLIMYLVCDALADPPLDPPMLGQFAVL